MRQDERRGKKEAKLGKKVSGTSFVATLRSPGDRVEKFYLIVVQLCVNRLLRPFLPEIGTDLCGHGNRDILQLARQEIRRRRLQQISIIRNQ